MSGITFSQGLTSTAGTRTFSASAAGATNHISLPVNALSNYVQFTNDGSANSVLLVTFNSSNAPSAGSLSTFRVKADETFDQNIRKRKFTIAASAGTAIGRFAIIYEDN